MELPEIQPWEHDAADLQREEKKRWYSPSSFFYSQGRALVLAANYFTDERLVSGASGGVVTKHLHRIHLALFGQLMASLEYLLKDFIAQVIDLTDVYDDKLRSAGKWIDLDIDHALSVRAGITTPGSLLLHSTLGWHEPKRVNSRYGHLFSYEPIQESETAAIERLWILRHSVAHNAGLVIAHDAARGGMPDLSDEVADIDGEYINSVFKFLCGIACRVALEVGDRVVKQWLRSRSGGPDYSRDRTAYRWLKYLASYVPSRARDLPRITARMYRNDFARATEADS